MLLSWNLGSSWAMISMSAPYSVALQCALVFHNENVLLACDSQLQSALDQLFLTSLAKTIGIACCTVEIRSCGWE
jgi:hypothetical protein